MVSGTLKAVFLGLVIGAGLLGSWLVLRPRPAAAWQMRQELLSELLPVTLDNCTLERVGSKNDGGYLMCGNLLGRAQSAYSYGIAGDDNWGCSLSTRLKVPVHQYDCFDPTRPPCPAGQAIFHDECIGPTAGIIDARFYDSLPRQIEKNGDAGKTLVMKMDVEGAELDSLAATPDEVLNRIDQLAMELHAPDERNLALVRRLKQFFHVAHLHFNNSRCGNRWKPFPSSVYEVLFVSKRIASVAAGRGRPTLPHPLDAQNTLYRADCQALLPVGP